MFRPSNDNVPRFGFKSSLIVVGSMALAAFVFPLILNSLGLELIWLRVIVAAATGALAVGYVLFFVESDKGFTNTFFLTVIFTFAILFIICYFWFNYVLI